MREPLRYLTPDDAIRSGACADGVVGWLAKHAPDACVLPTRVAVEHDVDGRIAKAARLDGYGCGHGYGDGDVDGYSYSTGDGNGYVFRNGYGYLDGTGDVYGNGDGDGCGNGNGYGDGYGDGWSHAPREGAP